MKPSSTEPSWPDESSVRSSRLIDQVVEQIIAQQHAGVRPQIEEYLQQFPQLEGEIREVWSVLMMVELLSPADPSVQLEPSVINPQLAGKSQVDSWLPDSQSLETSVAPANTALFESGGAFIGRYRIQRQLGRGGFGTVYLAKDSELDRLVAIKLPHLHRMTSSAAKRTYLLEARTLAKLDHPNIVPVFDFGMLTDGRCFVVSKYVDGQDLSQLLKVDRFSPQETASLISTVAAALHCVHQARVVHRDIKPANILIGHDERVFVADFGLALAETASEESPVLLGTPGYMSPEQIRREGHRVDGRSDQFSLGIVMYELLTGERPFKGGNSSKVMQEILESDPIPPSQLNPSVPRELSRICMKLLSRLASDRYVDMLALAKDLDYWQELESINVHLGNPSSPVESRAATKVFDAPTQATASLENVVIPRGLRAFSRRDSYFFMDLVPGVRDRDGIPESLSHWKNWVHAPDYANHWHQTGVISGPTGCGKSSLVRAGLIPLLGSQVTTVFVEATPDLTEKHLHGQLLRCSGQTTAQTLPELVMEIRRGGGLEGDQKLLIIIDQFEQWLHGNPDPLDTDLLQAIRQCDGKHVQCLLLIRDDFWLALSRFMKAADTPLQLGRNAVMVDLFDQRHAKNVLTEFGRGYGALPAKPTPLSRDQEKFIEGAIQSLTIQNKVIPVQLSLFAEMVKSRDWTLSTLHRLGGSVGIGSQFLSEAFSVTYAPANQRLHEEAARSVLKSMLPSAGTDIKTCRRTFDEIRAASGYVDRDAINSLMTILESELKLITATESYDRSRLESNSGENEPATYQLSHDFLVPSIRDWLSAQQKATWRGRIEQTIAQQAEYWAQHRQRRFLPSFWEWLQALLLVPRHRLGAIETEMLRARSRLSLVQICMALLILLVGVWGSQATIRSLRLNGLISRLQVAETSQVPRLLDDIERYGDQGQAGLHTALTKVDAVGREAFLLQLAQVTHRPELQSAVLDYALNQAELPEVLLACTALQPYAQHISLECWKVIESAEVEFSAEDPKQQIESSANHLRALVLLAGLNPNTDSAETKGQPIASGSTVDRWSKYAPVMTKIAVRAAAYHPNDYRLIVESLRPVSTQLNTVLTQSIGHPTYDSLSFTALSLLRDFTEHDPSRQTSLCLHAAQWQRPFIVPAPDRLDISVLRHEFERKDADVPGDEPERLKRELRRAMAATLLLTAKYANINTDSDVWSIFRRSNDLTARSLAIQLAGELRVPSDRIEQQVIVENDPGVLAALLQILGGLDADRLMHSSATKSRVAGLYMQHPDSGVHSSAKWCLTQWNDLATLGSLTKGATGEAKAGPVAPQQWLVTPSGDLMLKIPGKQSGAIGHDFLISAHEVTIDQFREFTPGRYFSVEYGPAGDCPANIIKWKDAVAYCNWLSDREGFTAFYPSDPDQLATWQPSPADLNGPGYRLPQEAEWEFAARGGTQTDRPFGIDQEILIRYDWCLSNRGAYTAKHRDELRKLYADQITVRSKPVGQLLPNEYGLFDVLGNVAEWCNDLNPNNQVERAIRGGAAGGAIRFLTVNHVGTAQPNEEFNSNGFRVVRTLSP